MALITAEAKFYNGTLLNLADKRTGAVLTTPVTLSCIPLRIIGATNTQSGQNIQNIRSNASMISDGDFAILGGVANPTAVSTLRCGFPTYVRIDFDKIHVPEGKNVTIKLEEGFVLEGFYPGSTREPIPANNNLLTFRTPKRITQNISSEFSLVDGLDRLRRFSAAFNNTSSLSATGIYNPGSFAALLAGLFQLEGIAGNIRPLAADFTAVSELNVNVNFVAGLDIDLFSSAQLTSAIFGFLKSYNADLSSEFNIVVEASIKSEFDLQSLFSLECVIGTVEDGESSMSSATSLTIPNVDEPLFNISETVFGNNSEDFFGLSPVIAAASPYTGFGFWAASAPFEDSNSLTNRGEIAINRGLITRSASHTIVGTANNHNMGTLMSGDHVVDQSGKTFTFNLGFIGSQQVLPGLIFRRKLQGGPGTGNPDTITSLTPVSDPEQNSNSQFGRSFKIKNDKLIASGHSNTSYLFDFDTGNLLNTFNNKGIVSVSGDFAVIANRDNEEVYVYQISTNQLVRTISNPDNTIPNSQFGFSVDVQDRFIAVGAPGAIFSATSFDDQRSLRQDGYRGRVYIFDLQTGNLIHQLTNPSQGADQFGSKVAMSRGVLVASDPTQQVGQNTVHGAVKVFNCSTGQLMQDLFPGTRSQLGIAAGSGFVRYYGSSIDINGNWIIVGAPTSAVDFETDRAGFVQVWRIQFNNNALFR